MRPNTAIATQIGDLGGEKVKMSFDQNSLSHIMSVLTDLYSDPELAVIREYSTNGLDAQIRAGVNRPIEVTTPTSMTPFFKVKDYGVGMDADDIKNVYSQYGASTKRDSDEFTGMLGLGCKAALTYTNQFTVNAVKNGVRTQVVVSRSEDGSGVMEILSQTETDDFNGVEISVPVKRYNQFERKAMDFFKFWDKGTVLLNGKEPDAISGRKLNDNLYLVPDAEQDYVIMGNVPYPVDEDHAIHKRSWNSRFGVIARVEIGEVSFTPSREALHYTIKTENTLKRIREEFHQDLPAAAQKEINAAVDYNAALDSFIDWSKILHGHLRQSTQVKYRGQDIPVWITFKNGMNFRLGYSRAAVDESRQESIDELRKRVVIFNYTNVDIKSHNREKIRGWLAENNLHGVHTVLVTEELPPEYGTWLSKDNCYDWNEVKKFKKPRVSTPRDEPTYDVYVKGSSGYGYARPTKMSEIGDLDIKALVTPANLKEFHDNFITHVRKEFPDIYVIPLAATRWEKLKRERKNVIDLKDIVIKRYNEVVAALTEEDKIYMMLDSTSRYILPHMDETEVKDPQLAQMIRVSKGISESDTVRQYKRIRHIAYQYGTIGNIDLGNIFQPFERYPLLSGLSRGQHREHGTYYVNAVYDALYA